MTFIDLDNNMKQDVKMSKDVGSLEKFRISAMDCFEKLGLPNKRMERWKYTDLLRKLSGYDMDIMQPPKGFAKDCHASIRNTSKVGFENLNINSSTALGPSKDKAKDSSSSNFLPKVGLKNSIKLYFQNGLWLKDLTNLNIIPEGVEIKSLSEIILNDPGKVLNKFKELDHSTEPMLAMNQSGVFDGVQIDIKEGVIVDEPIELIYLELGDDSIDSEKADYLNKKVCSICNYRNFINIGKDARVKIIEHVDSSSSRLNNVVSLNNIVWQFDLKDSSRCDYLHYSQMHVDVNEIVGDHAFKVNAPLSPNSLVHYIKVNQSKDSVFSSFNADFNANFNNILQRFDIDIDLNDSGARCQLNGVYTLSSKAHSDHHTRVNHLADNTISDEHYNGVLSDKSVGVFNGQVIAYKGVKSIEANQLNNNLLLNAGATIYTKPQLEIETDDIQCSHGASVGELDEQSLFYLLSRGIDNKTAKLILTKAFLIKPLKHEDFSCWDEFVSDLLAKAIRGNFWCQKEV